MTAARKFFHVFFLVLEFDSFLKTTSYMYMGLSKAAKDEKKIFRKFFGKMSSLALSTLERGATQKYFLVLISFLFCFRSKNEPLYGLLEIETMKKKQISKIFYARSYLPEFDG